MTAQTQAPEALRPLSVAQAKESGIAGLIARTRARSTRTIVGLYDGEKAGLDTGGGRWTLICETHGEAVAFGSRRIGSTFMSVPEEWCSICRDSADESGPPAAEIVVLGPPETTNPLGDPIWEYFAPRPGHKGGRRPTKAHRRDLTGAYLCGYDAPASEHYEPVDDSGVSPVADRCQKCRILGAESGFLVDSLSGRVVS